MIRTVLLTSLLALIGHQFLHANNGSIAYIYPMEGISIDGNLNDWPADIEVHKLSTIHYGDGIDGPEDGFATWRAGYNAALGVLYVGVTMADNDYVKTPDNNDYTTHDFQVLYLDPLHSAEGSGVIAYEIDEDHRKIVEQAKLEFYPQVKAASFDQIELVIKRLDNTVTYEWKVQVDGPLINGRVIGFDYAVFDKDTDEDHVMITWGRTDGAKFMNSNRVGDLVLLDKGDTPTSIMGSLIWDGPAGDNWPVVVRMQNIDIPEAYYTAAVDSLGHYALTIPAGTYKIIVPSNYDRIEWNKVQVVEKTIAKNGVTIRAGGKTQIDPVEIKLAQLPDLIPSEGILQTAFGPDKAEKMDHFVDTYQKLYNIPAVSLALIQDGQMVYHKTYGVENAVTKAPLRNEAVFEAASITKLVFAYLMNRLVQRDEFDLDKPLHESLAFPELEEYPDYKLMTARHVLTHVSGLPNWGARMINTPGTKYGYSGEGFEYLKKVLAGGPTDSLPAIIQGYLEREILNPLDMTNTYFMCNDVLPDLKVAGHYDGIPNMFDCPDWPGMAYSMHTEAKDFVPFAIALLNRDGLTEKQASEMFRFHTLYDEEDWIDGYKAGFGLGVALRDSPYGLVFGHGGNNGDFRCSFEMYDALKSGYIVFTNANTAEPLLYDLMKFLFEGK